MLVHLFGGSLIKWSKSSRFTKFKLWPCCHDVQSLVCVCIYNDMCDYVCVCVQIVLTVRIPVAVILRVEEYDWAEMHWLGFLCRLFAFLQPIDWDTFRLCINPRSPMRRTSFVGRAWEKINDIKAHIVLIHIKIIEYVLCRYYDLYTATGTICQTISDAGLDPFVKIGASLARGPAFLLGLFASKRWKNSWHPVDVTYSASELSESDKMHLFGHDRSEHLRFI